MTEEPIKNEQKFQIFKNNQEVRQGLENQSFEGPTANPKEKKLSTQKTLSSSSTSIKYIVTDLKNLIFPLRIYYKNIDFLQLIPLLFMTHQMGHHGSPNLLRYTDMLLHCASFYDLVLEMKCFPSRDRIFQQWFQPCRIRSFIDYES